jgi:hypothetical protein
MGGEIPVLLRPILAAAGPLPAGPAWGYESMAQRDSEPEFVDYLYVAFTNSTAFSPTDTMPITRLAKPAMMAQAAISVTVVVLGIARAVNLLQ